MKSFVNTVNGKNDSTRYADRHTGDAGRRETRRIDNAVPPIETARSTKPVATIAKRKSSNVFQNHRYAVAKQ
jgi:hypothetical protein